MRDSWTEATATVPTMSRIATTLNPRINKDT
jgi:hypothetical protein